jgi:hypothetical protein
LLSGKYSLQEFLDEFSTDGLSNRIHALCSPEKSEAIRAKHQSMPNKGIGNTKLRSLNNYRNRRNRQG